MNTNLKPITLFGIGLAIFGSFSPWMSANTIFGDMNVAGTTGDGRITLVLALIAGANLYMNTKKTFVWGVAMCVLGLITSVGNIFNVNDKISTAPDGVSANVGYGLYLCVIGFLVAGIMFVGLVRNENRYPEVR